MADGKRLHKSSRDKVFFGVCGGLAEYFDVDPVLMRIAFVVFALANGAGLLLYIILAIVMPREEDVASDEDEGSEDGPSGVTSDLTGGEGPAGGPTTQALQSEGRSRIRSRHEHRHRHERRRDSLALILIAIGVVILLANLHLLWWLSWTKLWPVALIVIGVAIIVDRVSRR